MLIIIINNNILNKLESDLVKFIKLNKIRPPKFFLRNTIKINYKNK